MAHQGLADLGYRAADKPAAVVGRLAAVVGMPAAVVGRLAAAHKHAGEPQLLLADDERLLLVRAEYGRLPLADDVQLLLAGVEPLQRGQVVVGFVLRFSDRNRGRTCSLY